MAAATEHSPSFDPSVKKPSATTPPDTPENETIPVESAKTGSQVGSDASKVTHSDSWRPAYHLMAPSGWMDDPCGPGYDPAQKKYFVSFQWNPHSSDWGDISWGQATSTDLLNWKVDQTPALEPDQPYDKCGVFTGCLRKGSVGEEDREKLVSIYTSVSSLPIHYSVPYNHGSESLSIATSTDNGKTWEKLEQNPVVPSAPVDLEVTGWRDPYVASWKALSSMLGKHEKDVQFGLISGGIKGVTPTTFLYEVDSNDLSKWTYLGPLLDVGINKRLSRWSADLGCNWECANFMTLKEDGAGDDGVSRDFITVGVEGIVKDKELVLKEQRNEVKRVARCQAWISGTLETNAEGKPQLKYKFGGQLDWGLYYAANSFYDPVSKTQIIWAWISEDDISDDLHRSQGWSGLLALPRELKMRTIHHVSGALRSDLKDITSFEAEPDDKGCYTMRTLGSEPVKRVVEGLRSAKGVKKSELRDIELDPQATNNSHFAPFQMSLRWELNAKIRVSKRCKSVSIELGHSSDFSKSTSLVFYPETEEFTVQRPSFDIPDSAQHVNSSDEKAPHTLFNLRNPASGEEDTELFEVRAWRDNSVLEIFLNGRTTLATRVYGGDDNYGMRFVSEDEGEKSVLVEATVWDGIGRADE